MLSCWCSGSSRRSENRRLNEGDVCVYALGKKTSGKIILVNVLLISFEMDLRIEIEYEILIFDEFNYT
jgi:hypothetical protein